MIKHHPDFKAEKEEYQRRGYWQKIGRAIDRLSELQCALDQWQNEGHYRTYIEEQIQRDGYKTTITKLKISKSIPIEWTAIIGDFLQNLRSSLDHIAFAMVDKSELSERQLRRVYFPIMESICADSFKKRLKETKLFNHAVVEFFAGLKPFRTGDVRYWHLNELARIDRHRLLLTAIGGIAEAGHGFPSTYDPAGSIWAVWNNFAYNQPIPIKDGMDIMRVTLPAASSSDVKMSMQLGLFLDEPNIFPQGMVGVMPLLEELLFVTAHTAKAADSARHTLYADCGPT